MLLVDCVAVVKEHEKGQQQAQRPGLLYTGAWRRAAWPRLGKIWKVALHFHLCKHSFMKKCTHERNINMLLLMDR